MLREFGKFISEIFQDVQGFYSSKRTIAFLAFFFMLASGIVNLATGVTIAEFIFEGMLWIVIGALGITVGDQVAEVFKSRAK